MQEYNIIFSKAADLDLEDIILYLSNFSSGTALKYYDEIIRKIHTLEIMPERCSSVASEELREKGHRWIFVRNYTIFFTIHKEENVVVIRRILYAKREYTALL